MDLRQNEWDGMNWIDLAQDRDQWRSLVNKVMNLLMPKNVWKFLECLNGWRLLKKDTTPWSQVVS
jgi:uncharacterized protein (DUF2236 family)